MKLRYAIARIRNLPNDARNVTSKIIGGLRGNSIPAYWYNYYNAGDQLTPLLLHHYGYSPVCVSPHDATIASVGSLLEDLPPNYSGIILGSGFIKESSRMSFPRACVLAVRGKLTRERMGRSDNGVVLGDPGLLVSQLFQERKAKRILLGLIPHYVDRRNPAFLELIRKHGRDIKVIDILKSNPLHVVREIAECEHILSSSLHGLVMSDSLGISNGWFHSSGIIGGRFKYDDYYSALGLKEQTMHVVSGNDKLSEMLRWTSLKPADPILQAKADLHRLFSSLSQHIAAVLGSRMQSGCAPRNADGAS